MPTPDLTALEAALGHTFTNSDLLVQALTHRSWIEEQNPGGAAPAHLSQQRLEFLGDALLTYVVGRWVFDSFPTEPEGELTKRRVQYTRGAWLQARGEALGLASLIRFGRGAGEQAASNRKVLEDTTEAILGAMVADDAEVRATELILEWVRESPIPAVPAGDPTSLLNEWYQAKYKRDMPEPEWESTGSDHQRSWTGYILEGGFVGVGTAPSKKEAKKLLALDLLTKLRG